MPLTALLKERNTFQIKFLWCRDDNLPLRVSLRIVLIFREVALYIFQEDITPSYNDIFSMLKQKISVTKQYLLFVLTKS